MARPQEKGLEYTRLELGFISDRKVKKLRRLTDSAAPLVYIQVMCTIFKEGYYVAWDEDLTFDIADELAMDEAYVANVIDKCFDVGLLSREMFDKHGILTSRGIQKQYAIIKEKSKSSCRVNEYSLLEDGVSSEETPINAEETWVSSGETAHEEVLTRKECNKEKKRKEKESKVNYSFSLSPSPGGEEITQEEEKEKIVSYFFFEKNWPSPGNEYEELVAYNNRPEAAKKWDAMSKVEKESVIARWKQEPQQRPRFVRTFLEAWRKLYDLLIGIGAPFPVRMAALDDGVRYETQGGRFTLYIADCLRDTIEREIDRFLPILRPLIAAYGCKTLQYETTQLTQTKQLQL